ncbi:amino acid ABC transporter permease [Liquorilactobacillus satsumensis]|uniref:Abc-type amino acid transport system, permease component n=1 Tax=Liquorilactobacillus satsumensis DSM 16230 = JCM 12392 TaxID=1423801 RepID=A0A0R1V2B4_9LACO|nr:amino acid ABC transporter permease [Liquorilactobacillus satsumensis]KRL97090.1 abc-type amino acid transport system, permease component [Liquorilactobacillus satsumensis DSM 16230 = JCM 12392]MCC7666807.1 amino acid ABC transporter permease [Liquorilactobacillus satsumensis]MCP9312007.1 amino acid ABC transporter permease [Liquorilactobacillus satsumensis]MCP9328519.1 amino acid ABC transporter permease [Liquorilactobacillus satsumensis]MCP9358377.1 amino acid ABC transporter permease [Li
MKFDWSYFLNLFPQLIPYIPLTILMAIAAMVLAVVLGAALTLVYLYALKPFQGLVKLYVSFFRGVPTLVLLFIIYYGLPEIFPVFKGVPATAAAIAGLGVKESAYLIEIFRAGITSVDQGQIEAGESLNFSYAKIFCNIVLPQAALNALPATGNTFVSLLKETSLAFTLGVTEIFADGKLLASASLRFFEVYVAVGLIYWFLIVLYSWAQRSVENILEAPYRRVENAIDKSEEPRSAVWKEEGLKQH